MMQLTHRFSVPTSVDEAWAVLRDIERVAPCMPGATLESVESDGAEFTGQVKVRLGPMQVSYRGQGRFVELDEQAHRAKVEATGKELRGSGTAKALVTAELANDGDQTQVTVVTELAVTGRPAQFGRGVMNDVGQRLLDQFAATLAEQLRTEHSAAGATSPDHDSGESESRAEQPASGEQPLNLLKVAGPAVAKRAVPLIAAAALVVLIIWALSRRG